MAEPVPPQTRTARGEKPGFPLLGPRTVGQRAWDQQSSWEPPSGTKALPRSSRETGWAGWPRSPPGRLRHAGNPPEPWNRAAETQPAGGRDSSSCAPEEGLEQLPAQVRARREATMCRAAAAASGDATKQGAGAARALHSTVHPHPPGALHPHKPASMPIICFLKKMRFV